MTVPLYGYIIISGVLIGVFFCAYFRVTGDGGGTHRQRTAGVEEPAQQEERVLVPYGAGTMTGDTGEMAAVGVWDPAALSANGHKAPAGSGT
jgi:hypothetical protein